MVSETGKRAGGGSFGAFLQFEARLGYKYLSVFNNSQILRASRAAEMVKNTSSAVVTIPGRRNSTAQPIIIHQQNRIAPA